MSERVPTDIEAGVLAFYAGDDPDGWDETALAACIYEDWVVEDPIFDMTDITDTGRAALARYREKEATARCLTS